MTNFSIADVIEHISDAFFAVDANGIITQVNSNHEKIMRRSRDQMLGRSVWDVFPSAKTTRFGAEFHKILKTRKAVQFEQYYEPLGIWIESNLYPTKDGGVAILYRDISAQKQVNALMEQRLSLALETAKMSSFDWEFKSGKIIWSEKTAELHGLRLDEFGGTFEHASAMVHPDDYSHMMKTIERSLEKNNTFAVEYRVIWPKDQTIRWLLACGKPLTDEQGSPARCVGNIIDITDRKNAEIESLKLAEIVRSSNDAIISKDTRSLIVSWNEAATTLFGYTADEVIGKSIRILIPKERQHEEDMILAALFRGERIHHYETERVRRDGTIVQVSISVSPLKDASGRIIGGAQIARDITNQKKIESALKDAIRARDEFMSVASHELKTPLTSLRMQTQIRKRRILKNGCSEFTSDKLQKIFEADEQQIERLNRLIDDMFDVGWINSRKLTPHRKATNLVEVVQDVVDRFSEELDMAGCKLTLNAESSVMGSWDHFRLEQVVTNLLSNAIKYASGKPIRIQVSSSGSKAILVVEDHGMGIAQQDQDRIFKQFEPAVGSNEIAGLGLGLYIVKEIIEAHNGTIHVESELGEGSRFIVEVPMTSASDT